MSRPSEYSEGVLKIAELYAKDWGERNIPSVADLAHKLDVTRKTLYNWGEKYPEFLYILEKINALQESTLLDKGLRGDYNSSIVKLALGKHGYHDKADTDITSGGEKLAGVDILIRKNESSV